MTSRYLVTGASGFLGLNLVEQLLVRGDTVVGISRDCAPAEARAAFAALPGTLIEIEADLVAPFDFVAVLRAHRIDAVINAAAITPADAAPREIAAVTIDLNVISAVRLLEAAQQCGVKRYFQPSSTSVYGQRMFRLPAVDEDEATAPDGLYATTKLTIERLTLARPPTEGMSVTVGRISSLFGPWERDTGVRDLLSPHLQLAGLAVRGEAALLERDAVRDWSYAPEVAQSILSLMQAAHGGPRLYNISCGYVWRFEEWADVLVARCPGFAWRFADAHEEAAIRYHGPRNRPRCALAVERLRAQGAHHAAPLQSVLKSYADWLRL